MRKRFFIPVLLFAATILVACASAGPDEQTVETIALPPTTATTAASATNTPPPTKAFTPTVTLERTFPTMTPTHTRSPSLTPAPSELSGQVVYDYIVDTSTFNSQIFIAYLDTGEIIQLTDVGSNN
ncbi:MAG: hypothetical protein JXB38_11285 [Anaerolineales bacterium]|nr:hypothetical protein [Anaerolineales bacterium]